MPCQDCLLIVCFAGDTRNRVITDKNYTHTILKHDFHFQLLFNQETVKAYTFVMMQIQPGKAVWEHIVWCR